MPKVRFYNGLTLPNFFCPFCDARFEGRIFRERFEWRVKLECGHRKTLGGVFPYPEMEDRGFINQDTPEQKESQAFDVRNASDKILEEQERAKRERKLENLPRRKLYL